MQTLTLRRVPPNLLVSQGATDFAFEMGIPILPFDALVSPAARDRWLRWRADLKAAERKARKSGNPPSSWKIRRDTAPEEYEIRERMREQHEKLMLQDHSALGQVRSSSPSDDPTSLATKNSNSLSDLSGVSAAPSEASAVSWPSEQRSPTPESSCSEPIQEPSVATPRTVAESSRNAFINSTQKVPTINQLKAYRALRDVTSDFISEDTEMKDADPDPKQDSGHSTHRRSLGDGSEESDSASSAKTMKAPLRASPPSSAVNSPLPTTPIEKHLDNPTPRGSTPLNHVNESAPLPPAPHESPRLGDKEDDITDTVGAIAVDSWGRIACGASSGGIGMKYRGRVGPAALVGVGSSVIPVDADDTDQTCVATVTSGTGEHMATTMAATVCAERIYQSVRKGKGGVYEEVTEDEALRAVIENDFMSKLFPWRAYTSSLTPVGHPSVRNSNSAGAIGILGIKKTRGGVFFYFGHNTDSFAMASMHSDEVKPWCSMSRSNGSGRIAQGGRMLRYKTKKRRNTSTIR